MRHIIMVIATILLLNSCGWNITGGDDFDYNTKSAKVVKTNNNFGLELFREVITKDDKANIMISPASISLALGMAYNGAETTTKESFDSVLNYDGLSRAEVNAISQDLIGSLVEDSKGNLLKIANAIWYREDFPVYQSFIDLNKTYYEAKVKELDFADPKALEEINSWVADNTNDKIIKILNELSAEEMMVLVNALYFNCLWEYEFDPDETRPETFYTEDGAQYGNVEMMHTEGTFKYASTDEFKAIQLPYKNGKFSMHLFLPNENKTVSDIVNNLDGDSWRSWMEEYREHDEVSVSLPKFKFAYERSIGEDLKAMGLKEAFSSTADFSGISEISLMISRVIHKTYIDLNEEGTEAAAVTAVVMELTALPDKPSIRLDRPFLFAITENTSQSIVFIGKVEEPDYEE